MVLTGGSAIAVDWAQSHLPAILMSWYPGQRGGTAVGQALFGDVNPAGRLPVTFYKAGEALPAFDDYAMEGEPIATSAARRFIRSVTACRTRGSTMERSASMQPGSGPMAAWAWRSM